MYLHEFVAAITYASTVEKVLYNIPATSHVGRMQAFRDSYAYHDHAAKLYHMLSEFDKTTAGIVMLLYEMHREVIDMELLPCYCGGKMTLTKHSCEGWNEGNRVEAECSKCHARYIPTFDSSAEFAAHAWNAVRSGETISKDELLDRFIHSPTSYKLLQVNEDGSRTERGLVEFNRPPSNARIVEALRIRGDIIGAQDDLELTMIFRRNTPRIGDIAIAFGEYWRAQSSALRQYNYILQEIKK